MSATNNGNAAASPGSLTVSLPPGISYQHATGPWACVPAAETAQGQLVTCTSTASPFTLSVNGSVALDLGVAVSGISPGGTASATLPDPGDTAPSGQHGDRSHHGHAAWWRRRSLRERPGTGHHRGRRQGTVRASTSPTAATARPRARSWPTSSSRTEARPTPPSVPKSRGRGGPSTPMR